jgi:hypothetical protein
MLTRVMLVLLVVLVILTGATAYMAYSAFNTVQAYAARFASVDGELGTLKTRADQLKTDSDAVSGRVKRVEDEVARFRR